MTRLSCLNSLFSLYSRHLHLAPSFNSEADWQLEWTEHLAATPDAGVPKVFSMRCVRAPGHWPLP